ncbi:amidase [Sphingomonas sp. So64.6b]|uniref:amidase n=1 Tax=Sphingomonas sp. So64.6b TaxID=2997354 RepID=UPI001601C6EF|nr:amidase [Sphingomonas sp. So64.6b]QNA86068.1 amidase [Sphingomonas sp. So64.6b]
MTDLHYLTIAELSAAMARRDLSPVEVVQAQLDRIGAHDGALHSYACVMADEALAAARQAEGEIAIETVRGPLHGVPLGIKDLFWTRGVPMAAGTAIHHDFRPDQDATAVHRLREAGAVLLGKLEMTEGAYSDYHPSITPPVNPWNADYWPGISSSGSAVAVAAGLCYGALASDTGGSIRWPAAATGVTGLKPSWGRVSRHGVFELAASLDHVGVLTRSAADAGLLLDAIAGADPLDPTAVQALVPGRYGDMATDLRGMRIGIDPHWNGDGVDGVILPALAEAQETLAALGAEIVEVTVPDVDDAIADWPANCAVEAAVAHHATYPSRRQDYGAVFAAVLDHGHALSALDYQRILLRRMALRGAFDALFARIELLLTPVHPFAPLSLAQISTLGEQPHLVARLQRYTCPFNMTGLPTLTLPGGHDDAGMPIAFQLVAGHLNEARLIRAGIAYQRETAWHRRHPPAWDD